MPMTSGEFGNLIAAETEKWGKVIRRAKSSQNDGPNIQIRAPCPSRINDGLAARGRRSLLSALIQKLPKWRRGG
jgi:hypothetical protein